MELGEKQIKSRQRVVNHGEVFTAKREVNAMLDMVKAETERIDSRFLEPACGDGNFLEEILRRKLKSVQNQVMSSAESLVSKFENQSLIAIANIYGIELLIDNVVACRKRLFNIWNKEYATICQKDPGEFCKRKVLFILNRNIICGNTLSLREVDGEGKDTERPIIFSEWMFSGNRMWHRDYRLDRLLEGDLTPLSNDGKIAKRVKSKEKQINFYDFAEKRNRTTKRQLCSAEP